MAEAPGGGFFVAGTLPGSTDDGDMVVWKLDWLGGLDPTFGTLGVAVHDGAAAPGSFESATEIVVDSSGRLVVVGSSRDPAWNLSLVLWRLDPAGALDPTFATGGVRVVEEVDVVGLAGDPAATGIALGPGGEISVTGGARQSWDSRGQCVVWRFDPDGVPDAGFGTNGAYVFDEEVDGIRLASWAHALALDTSGRMVVAAANGSSNWLGNIILFRLELDATLDPGFGGTGWIVIGDYRGGRKSARVADIAFDPQDQIIVAGSLRDRFGERDIGVWRYLPDGQPDPRFGKGGAGVIEGGASSKDLDDIARRVAVDAGGRAVVVGTSDRRCGTDLAAWRVDIVGESDPSFGCAGVFLGHEAVGEYGDDWGEDILIQPDGRIVVLGTVRRGPGGSSIALWRLLR